LPVPLGAPIRTDVAIVGSGAGGATVAGELARSGRSVVVVEAGPALTSRLGRSMRNSFPREDEQDRFAAFILQTLVNHAGAADPVRSLPGWRSVHAVGGMLVAWTNNCPDPHSTLERDGVIPAEDWLPLLERARTLLGVSATLEAHGLRQQRILACLRAALPDLPAGREVQALPVAGSSAQGRFRYSGADALFYGNTDLWPPSLSVIENHAARRLIHGDGRVRALEIHPRDGGPSTTIEADVFVIAAGTIGTPQLLVASEVDAGSVLGRYLMDHPSISTRFVLKPEILAGVPPDDPTFSVWIPLSERRDFHVQVYRFGFETPLPSGYVARDTADVITLCGQDPDPANRLLFDRERLDGFGLPAVSAEFALSPADRARVAAGIADQFAIVSELGLLAEGLAPVVWPLGGSFHLSGSCRMGLRDDGESVTDSHSRVWGYDNLFLAGNALFSARSACNPTLTTVAVALRCSDEIASRI
jgi:choline dehydrogenase-like flavoprotein